MAAALAISLRRCRLPSGPGGRWRGDRAGLRGRGHDVVGQHQGAPFPPRLRRGDAERVGYRFRHRFGVGDLGRVLGERRNSRAAAFIDWWVRLSRSASGTAPQTRPPGPARCLP